MDDKIYAVMTGDIIGSTRLTERFGSSWVDDLRDSLDYLKKNSLVPPSIFRGDSFQIATSNPDSAIKDAIILRLKLISSFKVDETYPRLDARIAIGLGKIDYLPTGKDNYNIGEMSGEAFRNSGQLLDRNLKGDRNLIVKTPWPEVDAEMDIHCLVVDRLISKWTTKQCAAVMYKLDDYNLKEIGEKLNISFSAVGRRLKKTDYDIVVRIVERYSEMIKIKINSHIINHKGD
ncbi:MAG: hypothetical protein PHD17_11080 [Methanothrix soehngenii]|jgi:predicted DNA-binding protein YlxM (UPF0122 family)|nr:hypothetical protein [Methanothrix soehngenii]HPY99782.1 hypothetical protein [bacterium]MDD3975217.1 hypothetical protein [Methanothrix soehngenii]MDD5257599.1 hypothetical protein [Methanothrix soehngenii]MDD5735030.1 hypothetical protein [Methanothrix soehngenii]HOE46671.1 hypothetical protein [Methanothrix soehngenii]